jgi:hypothetical protein
LDEDAGDDFRDGEEASGRRHAEMRLEVMSYQRGSEEVAYRL